MPSPFLAAILLGLAGAATALATGRRGMALETLLTTAVGALTSYGFIAAVLALVPDRAWTTVVGAAFLIWPGLINLAGAPFGGQPIGPAGLAWIAFAVGGLTGLFDGLWAVHRWTRLGLLEFLLDLTWGLAGSSAGLVAHLFNVLGGRHADDAPDCHPNEREARRGAHRYRRGLTPGRDFAFTLGAVMSNTGDHGPGSDLFRHEQIHVWQSRIAGPLFWTSYLAWMLIAGALAGLVALALRRPLAPFVEWWAYDQNPWEVMAYRRANPQMRAHRRRVVHAPRP